MTEVRVTFANQDSAVNVRRIVREQCDSLRRCIASAVQTDNIDQAKRFADELRTMEAALEAIRQGISEAAVL